MVNIGQTAVKIAGRDAGAVCAIVEILDSNYVMIDGQTRRRKCNIRHLEFLDKQVKLKKGAATSDVVKVLNELGFKIELKEKKKKEKKPKPVKLRKTKNKEEKTVKKSGVSKK